MPTNKERAHVMISGRVQGVFFRVETRRAARHIGASGWVRNTRDGRVEAVFEGNTGEVEEMIRWCQCGPPAAWVENVEVERQEFKGEFDSFSVKY
jgi:acylphosphatase